MNVYILNILICPKKLYFLLVLCNFLHFDCGLKYDQSTFYEIHPGTWNDLSGKTWCTARNKSVLDNAAAIISFIERDPGTDVSNMIRCYSTPHQFVEHRLQKNVSWNILLNGLKVKWWEVGLGGKVKDQIRNTRDRIIVYKCEVEDRVEWHELWRLIKHSQALLSFHVMLCLSVYESVHSYATLLW